MKKQIFVWMGLLLFLFGLAGCSGFGTVRDSSDSIPLDLWLEGHGFKHILGHLKTNSFMKDRPFIIVKMAGEAAGKNIDHQIDALTEDIRERMTGYLLGHSEVRVIRRHSVAVIERPYSLQGQQCGRFVEPEILIGIEIRRVGPKSSRQARISIRAVDVNRGEWIRGFSVDQKVALSRQQDQAFEISKVDQFLKGLRYVPFSLAENDEMGAFLAGNLSCMFSESFYGERFSVFVDASKTSPSERNIVWFVKKQLHFCNEIQLTENREQADWILVAEARRTGGPEGLSQFWIDIYHREKGDMIRGLATYAYYLSRHGQHSSFVGKWKILDLPEKSVSGFMKVTGGLQGLEGYLYGPDGNSLLHRRIFIQNNGRNLDWAYYDDRAGTAIKAQAVAVDDETLSVQVMPYPLDGRPRFQKFILEGR